MFDMNKNDNTLIMVFNGAGVVIAYVLLGFSLYLSTDVPLSTKGFWGIGILMLTVSLVNFVKYRFDAKADADRVQPPHAAAHLRYGLRHAQGAQELSPHDRRGQERTDAGQIRDQG